MQIRNEAFVGLGLEEITGANFTRPHSILLFDPIQCLILEKSIRFSLGVCVFLLVCLFVFPFFFLSDNRSLLL